MASYLTSFLRNPTLDKWLLPSVFWENPTFKKVPPTLPPKWNPTFKIQALRTTMSWPHLHPTCSTCEHLRSGQWDFGLYVDVGLLSYLRKLVSTSQHTRLPTFKKVPPTLPPKGYSTFKIQALRTTMSWSTCTQHALTCEHLRRGQCDFWLVCWRGLVILPTKIGPYLTVHATSHLQKSAYYLTSKVKSYLQNTSSAYNNELTPPAPNMLYVRTAEERAMGFWALWGPFI